MAEADALVVRWCGTDYAMNVTPGDTVRDLKRKFDESLPSSRQRVKIQTMDGEELAEQVLVSTLPNVINVYGLNQTDDISYNQLFQGQDTNFKCHVTDQEEKLKDFDGSELGISKGTYQVMSLKLDCFLKMGDQKTPLDRASFELIRNFRHPNSVALENIFKNDKDLCLILSDSVDGTVEGYIKKEGSDVVFNSQTKSCSVFFTNILTNLCGVLDKLIADNIYPKSLTTNQLFLKIVNGKPQLKVLFNSVEPLAVSKNAKKMQLKRLCRDIRSIICAYVTDWEVMNADTICFFEFLGKEAADFFGHNLKMVAESYPHNWTDETKSSYLIDLISASGEVSGNINKCGIKWPKNEAGNDIHEELRLIEQMIEDENTRKRNLKFSLESKGKTKEASKITWHEWNYDTTVPQHLVRLSRNLWKHFNTLPWNLKSHLGGSREGALRALEKWCPGVWFLIYNTVGLT